MTIDLQEAPASPNSAQNKAGEQIEVVLADDHALVRDGIRARLEVLPNIKVIGEASNGREAVEIAQRLNPHIVVLDISMPEMNGLEAATHIRGACPNTRILVLSIYDNPEYIQGVIANGAHGYILKDVSPKEMVNAIQSVATGGCYFSNKVAPKLVETRRSDQPIPNEYRLTGREIDILKRVALGLSNKEIARDLDISVRTAEAHRQNVRQKTGGGNAADLARIAAELGLI